MSNGPKNPIALYKRKVVWYTRTVRETDEPVGGAAEKRTPHYSLDRAQEPIRAGQYIVTHTALHHAAEDFPQCTDEKDAAAHVLALRRKHFYKSMTSFRDHRIRQDVYHPEIGGIPAYVKIQIREGLSEATTIIAFEKR